MSNLIHNWTDAYLVLKDRAEEVRGFIELHPGTGELERWPRTTGADVVAIAALVDSEVRALRMALGLMRRWEACLGDIERYALASPGEPYRENRALWRCLARVSVHLDSVDAPLPDPHMWSVLLDELGLVLALRNGPKGDGPFKPFADATRFADLYIAQYKHLLDTRGSDERDIEPAPSPFGPYGMRYGSMSIPRTTNADVVALVDYWNRQLADAKQITGRDGVERGWKAALIDVDAIARKGDQKALYVKNNAFWRELKETALHVDVAEGTPSKWDLAIDSVTDSIKKLPDRLASGASKAADVAGDIARGAGKIANQAGQGLFAGLGVPLLLGGGVLGAYLIARSRKTKEG